MSITVRPATPADVPWILAELRAFDRFFGAVHSLVPADPAYATTQLHGLIRDHLFLVAVRNAEDEATPVGFIAGLLGPHFFNPGLQVLTELFWWVPVAERGSRAGAHLLSAYLAYGRAHADWVHMTLEEHSPVNPETLERRGFRRTERHYLLEVLR